MSGITIGAVLAWLLAAFFIVGAVINCALPVSIRKDYERWGYPDWFHYVTAALELVVAALLLVPASRPLGAALGTAVMAAAAGTTLIHQEYGRAVAPSVVLLLTATLGWIAMPGGLRLLVD